MGTVERPKRNIYLRMKTLAEALQVWSESTFATRSEVERIGTVSALGRVTAAPVFALQSVPHYHGAAMDGFAVRAECTFGAGDTTPMRLTVGETATAVDTGDPLPSGANAVIMIEQVQPVSDREIEIRQAAFPWQHVRKVGEDIVAGELLVPQHQVLRPADLGALLAAGVLEVPVYRRPRVWIQPSGTELVEPSAAPADVEPGRIVEFNGTVLAAMVRECGGDADLQPIVGDDYASIRGRLEAAVDSAADLVLINAGSSAGSEDYTGAAIDDLGEVLVHGVTIMPGKPTILGMVRGKPVIGVPGYPVSAIMCFEQFVRPLLYARQGLPTPSFPETSATLARKLASKLGLEEFVRVIVGRVQGDLVAMPLQRGAGVITSLTRADGILQVPQELEGIELGEQVRVRLLRHPEQLDHTLIMIGSHDNTVEVLANELKRRDSRIHLSSSNVGSLGGLLALRRKQTHLAGSHLLEEDTGGYNFAYIEKYLQGTPVRVVQLAMRQQGLVVRPGNPESITGVADLVRPGVRFINRQAGSGTRILFDYCLRRQGIEPERVVGYDQEEFTHMAVAVNVLSGRADAGMAICAAARALHLEFVPVMEERYDLVIAEPSWEDPKVRLLLEIVHSQAFRDMVTGLGGYDVSGSGTLMGIWDGKQWVRRV